MLTLKKVNKAIQEIEAGWQLVKGNGYFYWIHPTADYTQIPTVPVCKLNDFTLERWIEEFEYRNTDY